MTRGTGVGLKGAATVLLVKGSWSIFTNFFPDVVARFCDA